MFNAADFDYHPVSVSDDPRSQAFINQRLRTWLTVQTSEHVEGDVHLVDQSYLLSLDVDRPVLGEHSVGFSAYFLPDRGGYSYPSSVFGPYRSAWDIWLGGRFRLALPAAPVNGFVIYNRGDREDFGAAPTFHHDGGGLKADMGVAVLFTGDFYRASPTAPTPDTLYGAFSRVQLEF